MSDLCDGDVALLRYWPSERTHWVRDVFAEPIPLDAPHLDPDRALLGVDVRNDQARHDGDRAIPNAQHGR